MKAFGFPTNFVKWIRILHNQVESCVLNEGFSTGYFPLSRGIRQGDPMAPYTFILIIEILAIMVKNNPAIKGLEICGHEIKIILFADDSTFMLRDIGSFIELNRVLDIFSSYTSLNINRQKSEVAWIGSAKSLCNDFLDFKYVDLTVSSIKILGIYFSYDSEVNYQNNLARIKGNFVSSLNTWKSRNLSLYGKNTILKAVALPKLLYVCNSLISSEQFIKSIKHEMDNFMWNGGSNKIKHNVMINNYQQGGIRMPDLDMLLKSRRIYWIKRFLSQNQGTCIWKIIPEFYFKKAGITVIGNNMDVKRLNEIYLPDFYKACLIDWAEMFSEFPNNSIGVLSQPLWNNQFIKQDKKSFYFEQFSEIGIKYIKDIVDANGNIVKFETLHTKQSFIFKWLILKHSIKKEWLNTLLDDIPIELEMDPLLISSNKFYCYEKLSVKEIYNCLVCKSIETPTGQNALNKMVATEIEWNKAYRHLYTTTIYTKLREFQFKILHNILPVNQILYRWKLIDSQRCSYCFINEESISHLFCQCHRSVTLYVQIREWCRQYDLILPN